MGVEEDIDLDDLSVHDARSTAPYHLINTALNLQGSKDIGVRDRKSDFFVFSKLSFSAFEAWFDTLLPSKPIASEGKRTAK